MANWGRWANRKLSEAAMATVPQAGWQRERETREHDVHYRLHRKHVMAWGGMFLTVFV